MKKNNALLLAALLGAGACAPATMVTVPRDGETVEVVECDQAAQKTITIVANKSQFAVKPPHLCVDPGDTITVNFSGNHPAGTFTIVAKPFIDAPWLSATNPGTNPDKATINVPGDAGGDQTYFYNVTAIGWGTIDPMVTVD